MDHSYDPTNFATKVRAVGVWFTGYDTSQLAADPRVYLVPVGMDVMRSPTRGIGETREWRILDQVIPAPRSLNNPGITALDRADWIPSLDDETMNGSFGLLRKFGRFPAHPDQNISGDQMANDTRLNGRSVWNTRWLLIIPAETLGSTGQEVSGLERFIDDVLDIRIYMTTYAHPAITGG